MNTYGINYSAFNLKMNCSIPIIPNKAILLAMINSPINDTEAKSIATNVFNFKNTILNHTKSGILIREGDNYIFFNGNNHILYTRKFSFDRVEEYNHTKLIEIATTFTSSLFKCWGTDSNFTIDVKEFIESSNRIRDDGIYMETNQPITLTCKVLYGGTPFLGIEYTVRIAENQVVYADVFRIMVRQKGIVEVMSLGEAFTKGFPGVKIAQGFGVASYIRFPISGDLIITEVTYGCDPRHGYEPYYNLNYTLIGPWQDGSIITVGLQMPIPATKK